ncbi:MAG TPA: transglutaminase-like domain-containing protein [Patescibacteria group bacterium]|nr:transglutaminase-like domain-containing protein [Patescibacteria group bacterium]
MHAAGEFTTRLDSHYSVDDSGKTHVTQDFQLQNNLSTVYAAQYALEIGSTQVENVIVTSNGQTLTPTIVPHSNKTSVSFPFSDKVIGKDQIRSFQVSYDTRDAAQITGRILEVNIPKLANPTEFSSYTVTIDVPIHFGAPTLTQPEQATSDVSGTHQLVHFTNVGQTNGISAIFGDEQIAKLSLHYNIENPKNTTSFTEIAIPSDTSTQRLYYESIDPQPEILRQDTDGNWLARYTLAGNEKKTILVVGYALISKREQTGENPPQPHDLYSQKYWETTDPKISSLAKNLKDPQSIYDFVVKTLTYDYRRIDSANARYGALGALSNPTASVCMEFTDLFIAIARSAGIPAREVNGYAYTQNGTLRPISLVRDVLHAWPEYWDSQKKLWIAVDPTWENTTGGIDYFHHFDFNHIAFVTHSTSSTLPLAAGLYKFGDTDSKDIDVSFTNTLPRQEDHFDITFPTPPTQLLRIHQRATVRIHNASLHAVYNTPVVVRIFEGGAETNQTTTQVTLPPLSDKDLEVVLPQTRLFATQPLQLQVSSIGKTYTHDLTLRSVVTTNLPLIAIAALVAGSGLTIIFIAWRLLVPRRKR